MKIKTAIIGSISMLAWSAAWAATAGAPPTSATDAATWLHVSKTIRIKAPPDMVWNAVKDFDAINTWHPAVDKDEIVEGKNNRAGAVRLLTLKGGGTIKERLLRFNAADHSFAYEIVEGVLPVSDYRSRVVVKSADDNVSRVTWSGRFKRKNVGANPADNENDKTAVDAVGGVYQSGLDNLKKMLEGK